MFVDETLKAYLRGLRMGEDIVKSTTEKIICAVLEADNTVTPHERSVALSVLNGQIPEKPLPGNSGINDKNAARHSKPANSYLRRNEAAAYMNVCVRMIDKWKHDGKLPFCLLGSRLIVFRINDLDRFMAGRLIDVSSGGS